MLSRPAGWPRRFLPALGLLLLAPPASAQTNTEVVLDTSPQLFAVLCAARAGGLAAPAPDPASRQVVARVDAWLARLDPAVVEPLRAYFAQRRTHGSPEDLSPYVSLALMLDAPPELNWSLPVQQLPPDVWDRQDFAPLLRAFYTQANLAQLWRELQPMYEEALAARQAELPRLLLETRGYLRMAGESYPGRAYVVYGEWLLPPALTSARNYGENYYLVIHFHHNDFLSAVRHQFLHFVLDPIVAKYAKELGPWAGVMPAAALAPRLPESFRTDLPLLTTECLVQAVELRLGHLSPDVALQELDTGERSGYVFLRHFYDALGRYEVDDPSLRYYFPDLLKDFDVQYERARLERLAFLPPPTAPAPAPVPPPDPTAQLLAQADSALTRRDYRAARAGFERVLQEGNPDDARALYGMAIVTSAEGNRPEAKRYFLRALDVARDPGMLGWTHVYLGRIYDLEGNREEALAHYRAALALNTRIERVEQAARRGLEQAFGQGEESPPRERP